MKYLFILSFFLFAACTSTVPEQSSEVNVPQDAFDIRPLLIGESLPDVSLTGIDGNQTSIAGLVADKPSMIVFYRGGWCPFCSSHLGELAAIEEEIYELGYQILAISPDQPEYLRQSLEEQELSYTLLSDSSMEMARAFGVAFRVDDQTVAGLKENGMDIVERSGHQHQQLPVPAVFITDTSGQVLFQYVNPEYRERISGEVLIAALRAFEE